ncbi:MAG: undecaprenyldiphospho-muramoylpentapeptide beta-N-acetylglucosaminyltransferase [Syntrophobacterales bacterium]|jgi:UDP-N-acetylglucosamine--N-acetylmuramyl-(pentapeptide) pyrophosphoryl-undecaprenol N-acetylglucosamine transferase|nr:undecaprenyldiphospho-muramoylpentapeptide beta-N-acetylglucosaminyltransferase [Syntrophobacterales bacterium]
MKMIIAGGGTGGHLFPGVAVAEEWLKRDKENTVLFVGTEGGIEKRVLPGLGFDLATIDVGGIKGKTVAQRIRSLAKLPRSFLQSDKIIRSFRPHMVLGVGGYASGPVVMMARFRGLKTAVAEQNAFPGVTNKILGRVVNKIFVTFSDGSTRYFPQHKICCTGNPIRAAFLSGMDESTEKNDKFTILVFGGSQGAAAINRVVLASLDRLEGIKEHLYIIHQTGQRAEKEVREAYHKKQFAAEVHPFIMDMPRFYKKADLLICRAGATSIAEITACGRASVLVPYPYATDDHQTGNAEVLARAGAAILIPEARLTEESLAKAVLDLYGDREKIRIMEEKSRRLARVDAAARIIDECLIMMRRDNKTKMNGEKTANL